MNKNDLAEFQIGNLLKQKGLRLVLAESCTGGLISDRITNVPGSSDYFLGCYVAYSYEAKETWLGVKKITLEKYGAVSRETVVEMARGARESLKGSFPFSSIVGLSVSGISGPTGATVDKPVGTVWIGLSAEKKEDAWHYCWHGNRAQNKAQSAQAALQILLDYLTSS
jgi:PncC family amidohydrolase